MLKNNKNDRVNAAQLSALPISIGEASKLLGPITNNLSNDYLAHRILLLSELARILTKTLYLQKQHYNYLIGEKNEI